MIFLWIGFLILISLLLALDLGVFNKRKHEISVKEAIVWTFIWIGISLLFNLFILLNFNSTTALQFLGGYLLEKSLSIDNIFVIFLIFASFKIDKIYQHKILFWGIVGAILLRGILIIIGSSLIQKFDWLFYIFGAFLIYSAIKMLFKDNSDYDPHNSWIVRTIHKIVPVKREHNGKFIVKGGITILLVTLIVIEFTDVIFALDSIPAIFGITTDPFIIFTSNIFAILGLRSLYFVVAKMHDVFIYLNYGLSLILLFIGAKMILKDIIHLSLTVSLAVVFLSIAVSIGASLIHNRLH